MLCNDEKAKTLFRLMVQDRHRRKTEKIDRAYVHKVNPSQVYISDMHRLPPVALHLFDEIDPPFNVFYGHATPNLNCDVCFDHPLDHYPMMSAFEIARQGAIAIAHLFYDVPLEGYVSIADTANFQFKQFMELDKPLYVLFADCNVEEKKGIHKRELHTLFIQEGVVCADFFGKMTAMPKNMYQRFRLSSRSKVLQYPVGKSHRIPTNVDVDNPDAVSAAS